MRGQSADLRAPAWPADAGVDPSRQDTLPAPGSLFSPVDRFVLARDMTSPERFPALLMSGMHRSGTSLMAATLRAAGLFIGDRLVEGLPSNAEGHFEDVEFHDLDRAILDDAGFPDHGLVGEVQVPVSAHREREAERLVSRRRALACPWGWKDPRTVLLLDFWKALLPEASFCFVVRAPWEVVDSLFRRGDVACRTDPMLPLRAWERYNRTILDFIRENPDRSIVFETSQMATEPLRCVKEIGSRMGISLSEPAPVFRPELLARRADEEHVSLVHAIRPESTRIFAELCSLAGSDAASVSRRTRRGLRRALERSLETWIPTAGSSNGGRLA